jgi:hypothetical protein
MAGSLSVLSSKVPLDPYVRDRPTRICSPATATVKIPGALDGSFAVQPQSPATSKNAMRTMA